jgi:amidase
MARTVRDAALMLSAIAGPDPRSPLSLEDAGSRFAAPLERDFHGVRVAWCRDFGGLPFEPEVLEVTAAGRPVLESLGCVVEEATPDLSAADEIFQVLRAWNFELSHGELMKRERGRMKDTVVWNIEQGLKLTGAQVGAAERKRTELFHRVREFMENYEFLAAPVVQVLPFDASQPYVTHIAGRALRTYIDWMKSCYWISVTGQPAASVPCGFSAGGLPVGLQIVGRHRDDFGVLQLAHAFEQATQCWQRRPRIAV